MPRTTRQACKAPPSQAGQARADHARCAATTSAMLPQVERFRPWAGELMLDELTSATTAFMELQVALCSFGVFRWRRRSKGLAENLT
eukprot:6835855-Prymnesium_polylepis.1